MIDLIYVVATVAFFALMLGYVSLCEKLGRSVSVADAPPEARP